MKRLSTLLVVLCFGPTSLALAQIPDKFTSLYNGKDLSGWYTFNPHQKLPKDENARAAKLAEMRADREKHWAAAGDGIVNDGHGAYLTTEKEYGDIELFVGYKTVAKADSGIYLRGNPQVQIWDTTKAGGKWNLGADKGSGGLYNNNIHREGKNALVLADKPFGEWNSLHMIQVGSRTTVYLNGKLVVKNVIMDNFWQKQMPLAVKGPIMLQTHGGEIRWRNLFVREIPPEEANEWLATHRGNGFQRVFNGKSFDGWAGPVENYEIKDEAIVCKPNKGGTIFTENEYGNFKVAFDFKLPPGGNNGLAIRYPGKGDTAYVGMCELQVLDNEHPKYANLKPAQYHGSAYGMAPAHRGFLRPAGTWNYQEVTVDGSKITVEVNGYVILDTDLSKITEFMANRPHPGKDRTTGHFGFAGHSDPVAFRNIAIKELD